jgi:hypothetical protein
MKPIVPLWVSIRKCVFQLAWTTLTETETLSAVTIGVISLAFIGPLGLGAGLDVGDPVAAIWDGPDVCAADTETGWVEGADDGDLASAAMV